MHIYLYFEKIENQINDIKNALTICVNNKTLKDLKNQMENQFKDMKYIKEFCNKKFSQNTNILHVYLFESPYDDYNLYLDVVVNKKHNDTLSLINSEINIIKKKLKNREIELAIYENEKYDYRQLNILDYLECI